MTKNVVRGGENIKKAAKEKREHLAYLRQTIGRHHGTWITANPSGTLADLRLFVLAVQDELFGYNDDDLLMDIIDELADAAMYLEDFTPVDEDVSGDGELATVGYRLANVEEDIMLLDELIEEVGEEYKVRSLARRKAA